MPTFTQQISDGGAPVRFVAPRRAAKGRESLLLYIDCPDPLLAWSGLGWLDLPADDVLPAGGRALGGGALLQLPDFQQIINGIAERLEAGVSGVDPETLALAISEAAGVKGADVRIGRATFDADWQLVSTEWIGLFRADKLTTNRTADQQRTITLSIGTEDTGRSTAPIAMFTPADQRRRSPTDRMFDLVPSIQQGTSRRFGLKDED